MKRANEKEARADEARYEKPGRRRWSVCGRERVKGSAGRENKARYPGKDFRREENGIGRSAAAELERFAVRSRPVCALRELKPPAHAGQVAVHASAPRVA